MVATSYANTESCRFRRFDLVSGRRNERLRSRIASEVLHGKAAKLRDLTAPLVEYVLAFYRLGETGPKEGKLVAFEREQGSEREPAGAQRKRASA